MPDDDLLTWWEVRKSIPWSSVAEDHGGPVVGARDGLLAFAAASARHRGHDRAARLMAALALVGNDAREGVEPSFERLAVWQAAVLGRGPVTFRAGPGRAKEGRERYGLDPGTQSRFRACLMQSADPSVPLPARVARVYLDVLFFHPFDDGNGRAAMLMLYFLLLRDGVVVDQAAPMLVVSRRADDRAGALALVRLVEVVINATRSRARGRAAHGVPEAHAGNCLSDVAAPAGSPVGCPDVVDRSSSLVSL